MTDRCAWIDALLVVLGSEFLSPCLDWRSSRRAWIGVLLAVLGSEFQIDAVLGSEFQMEISDRCAWIGVPLAVVGSAFFSSCLDRSSSRRAWIGVSDRRRAWIGVSDGNFRLAFEFQMEISTWIGVSDRRCAPCLDRNFKEFGIERSENVGIERSFREDSRTESRELRESSVSGERVFAVERDKIITSL